MFPFLYGCYGKMDGEDGSAEGFPPFLPTLVFPSGISQPVLVAGTLPVLYVWNIFEGTSLPDSDVD